MQPADFSQTIRNEITAVTGLDPYALGGDAPFVSFGLESLQVVAIAAELSQKLGREISPTLFFDYPSIDALADFLKNADIPGKFSRAADPVLRAAPVAIVGMACRFPGASNLEEFWQNLRCGVDAISETDRWNWRDYPNLPAMRWGGFLKDVASFDNELFGIAENEAIAMDPQQRLLLECVHEALENARLDPRQLSGSRTGVFVGISSSDYSVQRAREGIAATVFDATGNSHSIAANRISYIFNFKGPSLSLDTACSSSLVAFHEAAKSLAAGECDLAIVGGVNVILEPELTRAFAEAGMLAPDGRCKAFSDQANGYVRGEGAGAVVLQRVADASRIVALVRGSAVNHDGKTNGLTAPSGPAQEAVIREALAKAELRPEEIDFIEAHGTGTALGDPVEFLALGRLFGGRESGPLVVGSAKAFVGHLEAAAGVCGVIKAVLSLAAREVPRQLHFEKINPKMNGTSLRVATESQALLRPISRAGVSSFGFGGTNAHVILESAPENLALPRAEAAGALQVLGFSASDSQALRESASRWALALNSELSAEISAASIGRRLHQKAKLIAWGKDASELKRSLRAFAANEEGSWLEAEKASKSNLAFAFTGQGSQYPRMGEELHADPLFAQNWRALIAELDSYFPESLERVWRAESSEMEALLYRTDYGQALLFALELSLAEYWLKVWKVRPSLVLGHSLGEIPAAVFAGILSRKDACRLVALRGRLMQAAPAGGMCSLRGPREAVDALCSAHPGLELAAENGPQLFTLSGPAAQVEAAVEASLGSGAFPLKKLKVDRAFHSASMNGAAEPFAKGLDKIQFFSPQIPFYSTLSGAELSEVNAKYWLRQLRQPTLFAPAVRAAEKAGINLFLEIGPQAVLASMGAGEKRWVASLERNKEFGRALAEMLACGAASTASMMAEVDLPATVFGQRNKAKLKDAGVSVIDEIQALVAGLLQVKPEEVDPSRNLVDLGADSLLLLNAIQTIKDRFGVSIPIADVFRELTTLQAISAYVEEKRIVAIPKISQSPKLAPLSRGRPASTSEEPISLSGKGVLGNWRATANREESPEETARAEYVNALIARFNARTRKTKDHTQRYREFLADNRVSAGFRPNLKEMIYTIIFQSGQGAYFKDIDGNDYVDFTMGFGVNLFGHGPEFIEQRIRAQISQGYCVGPQAELAGVVAEKACRVLGHERIAFLNSGTEAVMTAIRLARAATGRNRVVIFEGSYHGHADVVLARSGGANRSLPVAPGVPSGLVGDVVVLVYGDESALNYIRTHGRELAAVVVEPVQSRYPEHQPVEFLREIRRLTTASDTAFIFDEVICGLRSAPGGAQENFGIKADLAAYGKVLGGGMPIGAVAGNHRFLDAIDGGFWRFGDSSYPQAEMTFFAGTFCKHPVTLAAADAVLDRFLTEGKSLTDALNARTAGLCEKLNEVLFDYGVEANHFGSLFRFKSSGNLDLLFANLNLRGFYVWEGRNLFLSTAHSEEDLARFVKAVHDSAQELEREGFFKKQKSSRALIAPQERFRALALSSENFPAAHIALAFELKGHVDRAKLQAAFWQCWNACDLSFFRFDLAAGMQRRAATRSLFSFEFEETRDAEVKRIFAKDFERPFDLSCEAPLRFKLLQTKPDKAILGIVAHHLALDGWSLARLLEKACETYNAMKKGEALPPLPWELFKEYAGQFEARTTEAALAQAHEFWLRQEFSAAPLLAPYTEITRGHRVIYILNKKFYARIRDLAKKEKVTPFLLLMVCFTRALGKVLKKEELLVTVPAAARDWNKAEFVVGNCLNLVPLNCKLHADPRDDLAQVKDRYLDTLAHALYPIEKISAHAGKDLSQVHFNFEPSVEEPELDGAEIDFYPFPVTQVEKPIIINVNDTKKTYYVEIDYQFQALDLVKALTIFTQAEREILQWEKIGGGIAT